MKNNLEMKSFWVNLEKNKVPKFLRNIIAIKGKDFLKKIKKSDKKYIINLTQKLYAGDFILLKKAINKQYLKKLKENLVHYSKENKSSFYKITEDCPNFWRRQDEKIAKKYSIKAVRDSFYFFRWNKEKFSLWKNFNQIWGSIKYLGGFNFNSYVKNTPKDIVVDRIQVVKYRENTGYVEPHSHHPDQRIIISIYMSTLNKDYTSGGTYFYKGKKKINVENKIEEGDVGMFYATLAHGVDKIKISKKIKLQQKNKNLIGRWWCGLYSPESNYKKKRNTSIREKLF